MNNNENEREQDLPVKEDNNNDIRITDKINKVKDRIKDRESEKDIVFSEPLTPVAPIDETAPLKKGGIDMWFLLWSMLLICLGAIMSYSASAVYAEQVEGVSATHYLWNYIIFACVACVVTVPFIIFARPWFWRIFGAGLYAVSVFLLILVPIFGVADAGSVATRWLDLGFVTIQPSEIAKMALVMMLALYMSKYEKKITKYGKFTGSFKHGFIMPMIIIGIICLLVAVERHISGVMILGLMGVAIMMLGGTRPKYLIGFVALIAVAFVFLVFVSSYAQARVNIWLNPESDPTGDGWQTLQGLYAIGSGGFFGLGLGFSRQKFGYVSQPQNDFIFTIICEELGFIGALLVVLCFCFLIWRGIKIGQRAPDKFSALVVWGLTFKIALQALLNIAVVTNTVPNTGITLPFFSAGGTSLMLQIFEIGIILSISRFSSQKK